MLLLVNWTILLSRKGLDYGIMKQDFLVACMQGREKCVECGGQCRNPGFISLQFMEDRKIKAENT